MSNIGMVTSPECGSKSMMCERPSVLVELQNRRNKIVQELSDVDEAIALFTSQPELEKGLSLLGRMGINRY